MSVYQQCASSSCFDYHEHAISHIAIAQKRNQIWYVTSPIDQLDAPASWLVNMSSAKKSNNESEQIFMFLWFFRNNTFFPDIKDKDNLCWYVRVDNQAYISPGDITGWCRGYTVICPYKNELLWSVNMDEGGQWSRT